MDNQQDINKLEKQNDNPNSKQGEGYGDRTYLVIANDTGVDIHVQVEGDVHEGNWGPNQVNHTKEPEVKSRKIDFGNNATYKIKIWKNDNGQPGKYVGDFEHKVRYNAAGNRDRLELVLVNKDNETYLSAFSVRKAIEVALLLWLGA